MKCLTFDTSAVYSKGQHWGPVAGWTVPDAMQCNSADHGSLHGNDQWHMHPILPSDPAVPPGVSW